MAEIDSVSGLEPRWPRGGPRFGVARIWLFACVMAPLALGAAALISFGEPAPRSKVTEVGNADEFCRQTTGIRRHIEATAREVESPEDVTPAFLAQLIEGFDLDGLDTARWPKPLQDDVAYLLDHREETIADLRGAPADAEIVEVLGSEVVDRFMVMVQVNAEYC